LTPIDIKIEEAVQLYQLTRGSRKEEAMFDQDMGVKHWLHPAIKVTILQDNKRTAQHKYSPMVASQNRG